MLCRVGPPIDVPKVAFSLATRTAPAAQSIGCNSLILTLGGPRNLAIFQKEKQHGGLPTFAKDGPGLHKMTHLKIEQIEEYRGISGKTEED